MAKGKKFSSVGEEVESDNALSQESELKAPEFGSYGTPRPMTSVPSVPVIVNPLDRAPIGRYRFVVAARNYQPQPVRYIVADNEQQAVDLYLKTTGIAAIMASASESGSTPEKPVIAVTKLSD